MSGIAGALLFEDAFDASKLVASGTNRMHYLGPDGLAHWSSGRVALWQCMLRAVPEAAREVLPLADSLALVSNCGMVYLYTACSPAVSNSNSGDTL